MIDSGQQRHPIFRYRNNSYSQKALNGVAHLLWLEELVSPILDIPALLWTKFNKIQDASCPTFVRLQTTRPENDIRIPVSSQSWTQVSSTATCKLRVDDVRLCSLFIDSLKSRLEISTTLSA